MTDTNEEFFEYTKQRILMRDIGFIVSIQNLNDSQLSLSDKQTNMRALIINAKKRIDEGQDLPDAIGKFLIRRLHHYLSTGESKKSNLAEALYLSGKNDNPLRYLIRSYAETYALGFEHKKDGREPHKLLSIMHDSGEELDIYPKFYDAGIKEAHQHSYIRRESLVDALSTLLGIPPNTISAYYTRYSLDKIIKRPIKSPRKNENVQPNPFLQLLPNQTTDNKNVK